MPETTAISWTDATWNPHRGCTKVSPGCAHCYMFRDQERYGRDPSVVVRAAPATFNAPLKWADPKLIFTCSWSDWFHEDADSYRDEEWDIIRRCPQHTFQILTKRPEMIVDRLPDDWGDGWPNVWLGVSVENARHTWRADVLRDIPAALRFISAEPLLGSLFPQNAATVDAAETGRHDGAAPSSLPVVGTASSLVAPEGRAPTRERAALDLTGFAWIIVGGESGSRKDARPMHPKWAREIRDHVQSIEHRTGTRPLLHMKQWGSWTPDPFGHDRDGVWLAPDGTIKGTSLRADATGDLPDGSMRVRYAGPLPSAGGKFLDGADWCEIPPVAPLKQLTLA